MVEAACPLMVQAGGEGLAGGHKGLEETGLAWETWKIGLYTVMRWNFLFDRLFDGQRI